MASSRLTSIAGQTSSSARVLARKPCLTRSASGVDTCSTHPTAQWWLVSTRPSGDTKEAEQPPAIRAEPRITRWNQAGSRSTPSSALSLASGGLSRVHMPSADQASGVPASRAVNRIFFKGGLTVSKAATVPSDWRRRLRGNPEVAACGFAAGASAAPGRRTQAARFSGSLTWKQAPWPGSLLTLSAPCSSSVTAECARCRPSPEPPWPSRVVKKGSKMRPRWAAAMPGPSSWISRRAQPGSASRSRTVICPLPRPAMPWVQALSISRPSTSVSASWSTRAGRLPGSSIAQCTPASSPARIILTVSRTRAARSTSASAWPALSGLASDLKRWIRCPARSSERSTIDAFSPILLTNCST
mmetsp:Transcript_6205/g.25083  ORF Transcript_6205/g.25083 Transcript_6205/m.25083 type:complete len:358 (+) Transcript_6205:2806-3879(+)